MKVLGLLSCAVLSCTTLFAGTAGTFRGIIVRAPKGEPQSGWIYVQSRNGNLRRAEVTNANVVYGAAVPVDLRQKDPQEALIEGTEVRVTAGQDGDGEWRALRVEILKVRTPRRRAHTANEPIDKVASII